MVEKININSLPLTPKESKQSENISNDSFQQSINEDNYIKSRQYVIKNNYWNDHHEKILKSLQKNSNKLYREYQKAHLKYKSKLKLYRIPIIIMSSLSGFLSISNSGYIPIEYQPWISLLVGFVNLMVTLISLIENFKKIDVNVNKTYTSYTEFKKLHDEISIMLNTHTNEREGNGYDIAMDFFNRYESYLSDAPILQKTIHDHLDENSDDNSSQTIVVSKSGSGSGSGSDNGSNERYSNKESRIRKRTQSYDDDIKYFDPVYFSNDNEDNEDNENNDDNNDDYGDIEVGKEFTTLDGLKNLLKISNRNNKEYGVIKKDINKFNNKKNNLIESTNKKIKSVEKIVQDRIEKVNRFQEQYDNMEKMVNNAIEEKVNKLNLENNLNISPDNFPKLKNIKISKDIVLNPNNITTDSDNYNMDEDELVDEEIIHKPFKSVQTKSKEDPSTSSTNS